MLYTIPHYYKKFQCIAGECPDTCCAGWQIVIDDRTRRNTEGQKGLLETGCIIPLTGRESCFQQYEGRCAFLNDENLCDIYQEAGKEMLQNLPELSAPYRGARGCRFPVFVLSGGGAADSGCREPVQFLTAEKAEKKNMRILIFSSLYEADGCQRFDDSPASGQAGAGVAANCHGVAVTMICREESGAGSCFWWISFERYGKEGAFRRMEEG